MAPSRLLDVTRMVIDEINDLLDRSRRRLIERDQLRRAACSIAANIRESNGRHSNGERQQFFWYANASAEEVDEHLGTNFRAGRIPPGQYWRLHNRLVVIRKIIQELVSS